VTPQPHLPGIFRTLEPLLAHYGYLAVGGLVLLEDFGVPAPGETVLIAAAVYAGAGRLNVVAVAALAFVAAVLGDNIGYAIGHFGGRELALRWGRYVLLTPERLDHAEDFFRRHGGKVVSIARFVEGLRQVNGIIAGISEMPWIARFVPYNALGAALWVGLWVTVGYTAGNHIDAIYHQVIHYEAYFGIAVVVVFLAYLGHRLWRRRQRSLSPSRAGSPVEPGVLIGSNSTAEDPDRSPLPGGPAVDQEGRPGPSAS